MDNDLNKKGHRIITKWFQPYMILEYAKQFFDVTDFTFNGQNKFEMMENFLNEIKKSSQNNIIIGLYMKNVNKFYLLKLKENSSQKDDIYALENLLIENKFGSDEKIESEDWVNVTCDTDKAFNMIDLGKAEASFIMNLE